MARSSTPRSPLAGLAFAALLAACGGAASGRTDPVPPGDDPPATTFQCTGPVPEHATLCPGAGAGLASDVPRALSGSCGCTATCLPVPCSYACDPGYVLAEGACAPAPPPPPATFTDHGDGTVTDDLTGLTWLRDAGCTEAAGGVARSGPVPWLQASDWVIGLADGTCGLADGSAAGDWTIPDQADLIALAGHLASPNPFLRLQAGRSWSAFSTCTSIYSAVDLADGSALDLPIATPMNLLPVRGRGVR